jgi:hypothetical protein
MKPIVLLIAICLVCACSDDDNGNANPKQDGSVPAGDGTTSQGDGPAASGCPTPTKEIAAGVCGLLGGAANAITSNLTLTADKTWVLQGGVFVGDDQKETVLTIEAGTTVYGDTAGTSPSFLTIRRHSRIMAVGTKEKPIVFTSIAEKGKRKRGDWGGIIINGLATINCQTAPCEAEGEGSTGKYGGSDDADSSGTLKYVRIEFAGKLITSKNELNSLALQAVGSGTTLEYIQVHMGADDGIEFFGGTASFKYVLSTGIDDDNLDWTDGWRGKGQFFVAQQYDGAGDNGIEADNNAENNTYTPRSKPTISNITLIGSPSSSKSDLGMLLREGTGANISNAIVTAWNEACLSINNDETYKNAYDGSKLSGELTLTNSIINCQTPYTECAVGDTCTATPAFTVADFYEKLNSDNQKADPKLKAPTDEASPDFAPDSGSPAASGAKVPSDSFFEQVTFIGGVDPANDWTKGWTTSDKD